MSRVKFITTEDLLEMHANDQNFKLVEVLAREEFGKGHIPRAINIPLDQLPELSKKYLTKSDTIVVYCASYQCNASTNAARALVKMGYKKTLDYKAGKKGWLHAGFELEK